jgi:L-asparagine oxygenase
VPPTPLIFNAQHDACPTATVALTQFSDAIGRAVGYDREQGGRLIQDIFPVRSNELEQVSSSSKVVLGSHTETAFHPHRPRFVVLLCLRSDPQAATTYADVADIVVHLSDEDLAVLQTNEFVTSVDPSFMSNGEPDAQVRVTPLTATGEGWSLIYDQLLMRGTTPRAIAALSALHHAVTRTTQQVVLAAGDILLIDNHRCVHGRTPFAPRYDGTDRWLKRALVVQSLDGIDVVDRVIQTYL